MELIVGLWVLYVVQCVVWLPRRHAFFTRVLSEWVEVRGPGWRLLHPWPSAPGFVGAGFPVSEGEAGLRVDAPGWLASQSLPHDGLEVDLEGLAQVRADERAVRLGKRTIVRAVNEAEASETADVLRSLANADAAASREALRGWFARRLSVADFERAFDDARRGARWLGVTSDVYALGLLVLLPIALVVLGAERGLVFALPLLGALHVIVVVAVGFTYRRLSVGDRWGLFEILAAGVLYPPHLLRAHSELVARAVGPVHPALLEACRLPEPVSRLRLRGSLLRARADADRASGVGIAAAECEALERLLADSGSSESALFAEPERSDPLAEGYCQACHEEYRRRDGRCSSCGGAILAFEGATDRITPRD